MKIFVLIIFISLIATAQSAQEQAAVLAAPAKKGAFKNESATRMLEELERQEQALASPNGVAQPAADPNAGAAAGELAAPGAPAVLNPKPVSEDVAPKPPPAHFVSHAVTTRYLFLKISDSLLRFHVDANLGDAELETVISALAKSCLKTATDDPVCDSTKQNTIVTDKAFLADAKLSQTGHWSRNATPKGQIWKLVCLSGGDDCFDRLSKVRAFKLTTNQSVLANRILAHGFESQAVRAYAKKRRAPASTPQLRTLDRVYMTRTTSEKIPLLPSGTL